MRITHSKQSSLCPSVYDQGIHKKRKTIPLSIFLALHQTFQTIASRRMALERNLAVEWHALDLGTKIKEMICSKKNLVEKKLTFLKKKLPSCKEEGMIYYQADPIHDHLKKEILELHAEIRILSTAFAYAADIYEITAEFASEIIANLKKAEKAIGRKGSDNIIAITELNKLSKKLDYFIKGKREAGQLMSSPHLFQSVIYKNGNEIRFRISPIANPKIFRRKA